MKLIHEEETNTYIVHPEDDFDETELRRISKDSKIDLRSLFSEDSDDYDTRKIKYYENKHIFGEIIRKNKENRER